VIVTMAGRLTGWELMVWAT